MADAASVPPTKAAADSDAILRRNRPAARPPFRPRSPEMEPFEFVMIFASAVAGAALSEVPKTHDG